MTFVRTRAARVLCAGLLMALLPGCVYYNTLYLAKRYYVRSFDDVPYALDKTDLSDTPQFQRTIDLSKKVVSQYPKSKYVDDAYLLWAKSLIGSDDPRQAVPMLEDFDNRYPKSPLSAEAQFYLGVGYVRSHKYEAALRTLDAFLAKNPKHKLAPYAHFERSRALLALDRPGDAAKAAGEVVERFPKSRLALRARIARAEALVEQKEFDAAYEDYRTLERHALTDDDRLEFLLREADCLTGAQKFDPALALLKDAIAHEREPLMSDTTGGRQPVAPTGPGADHYGRLLVRIGNVHARSGRLDDAVAAFRRVVRDYPRSPLGAEAQYRLGYAYETVGDDFTNARLEYAKVRDQGPGTSFTDQAAGRLASLDRLAQYEKASGDTLQRKAEGDFLLAEQYLFQLEKPERALEQYQTIEQKYPDSPWAAKAITAQAWVLSRKLDRKAAADSLFWKVVREHPATEAQLAARDYLEQEGVQVPPDLIKLPERVFTHADSVAADSALRADQLADSLAALTKVPEGSIPLGTQPGGGAIPADTLLGHRTPPFVMPVITVPTDTTARHGVGSLRDTLASRVPGSRDFRDLAAPDSSLHPLLAGDTTRAVTPGRDFPPGVVTVPPAPPDTMRHNRPPRLHSAPPDTTQTPPAVAPVVAPPPNPAPGTPAAEDRARAAAEARVRAMAEARARAVADSMRRNAPQSVAPPPVAAGPDTLRGRVNPDSMVRGVVADTTQHARPPVPPIDRRPPTPPPPPTPEPKPEEPRMGTSIVADAPTHRKKKPKVPKPHKLTKKEREAEARRAAASADSLRRVDTARQDSLRRAAPPDTVRRSTPPDTSKRNP